MWVCVCVCSIAFQFTYTLHTTSDVTCNVTCKATCNVTVATVLCCVVFSRRIPTNRTDRITTMIDRPNDPNNPNDSKNLNKRANVWASTHRWTQCNRWTSVAPWHKSWPVGKYSSRSLSHRNLTYTSAIVYDSFIHYEWFVDVWSIASIPDWLSHINSQSVSQLVIVTHQLIRWQSRQLIHWQSR